MHIRLAHADEREALEDLQRRASLALDDYRAQLEAHPDAVHLPAVQIALGAVLVAEDDGGVAGFVVVLDAEDRAEIDGLFVEPARWHQGIGSALVKEAVHIARDRGLSLMTVVASPTARLFYEKCGFVAEGEERTRFGPAIRMSR